MSRLPGSYPIIVLVISALLTITACQTSSLTETESFERAEVAYRQGQYKRALDGYQGFLKRYPKSPLASVARTRIRCVNREVRGMLGRKGVPRPIYRGESSGAGANQPDKSLEVKPERPAPRKAPAGEPLP